MKIVNGRERTFVLRFDAGEEVIQGIVDFCASQGVGAAWFQMIGASKAVVLSYWNLATKKYEERLIEKDLEVTGISGNVGILDGKPIVHAHGTLADRDFVAIGGHVRTLVVSATMEVCVTVLPGAITRLPDETTGLNLMS